LPATSAVGKNPPDLDPIMNLLVTGGCGFIGTNLIRHIFEGVFTPPRILVNLDKLTYAGNPANLASMTENPRYVFIKGDISDERLVADILSSYQIDAVVHLAAETHVDRSIDTPEVFVQANVLGTFRLLNAIRNYLQSLTGAAKASFRLLHVSTDEVYGSLGPDDPPFTEASAFAPNSPYAASKASSNHLVRAYQQTFHLPAIVATPSNNYGPYQFPEKLIPLMILNAIEGRPLPIHAHRKSVSLSNSSNHRPRRSIEQALIVNTGPRCAIIGIRRFLVSM
jgi:dTDP-glucose 4,6-dehydratase